MVEMEVNVEDDTYGSAIEECQSAVVGCRSIGVMIHTLGEVEFHEPN